MAIRYKGDIMGQLKAKGYSTARLRKERVFGERTMQDFRTNAEIPYKSINRLCSLLDCQPGDVLEYVPDAGEDTADDAFCNALYEQYKADPDKRKAVSLEDAMKILEVNKDA